MNYTIGPISYGWVCCKCGRVYSPTQMMCLYCPAKEVLTNSTSTSTIDLFGEINLARNNKMEENENEVN